MEAYVESEEHSPLSEDLFPFPQVRKGQDRFLLDARNAFSNGSVLLAQAPTGLGKTAVSLAAGLESSLEAGALFYTTARQSQHVAVIETLRRIWRKRKMIVADLIAREDMCFCRRNGRLACTSPEGCYFRNDRTIKAAEELARFPLNVQEATRLCLRLGTCPYQAMIELAMEADVVVCDYSQIFTFGSLMPARQKGSGYLVVDEAHNLPARLMEANSGSMNLTMLDRAKHSRSLSKFVEEITILEALFRDIAYADRRARLDAWELDDPLRERCGLDASGLAEEIYGRIREGDLWAHRPLLEFLTAWSGLAPHSVRFIEQKPLRLITHLVDPSMVARPVLSDMDAVLLMSGTLHPPEMFADLLGIADRCACRSYPSPFPPENRRVLALRGVSSRFQQRSEKMYKAIAQRIMEGCELVPGNLAIFFPSYDFMNNVMFHLRDTPLPKKIILESRTLSKNEKDAMVADLHRQDSALFAVVSGSFAEGVDFKENLLSAVIVVGLPLSPPSAEQEATLDRMEAKFGRTKAMLYTQMYPALTKVRQAMGRAVRSESDRAAIVLLDDRYLLASVRAGFPEGDRPQACNDLAKELVDFFGAGTSQKAS